MIQYKFRLELSTKLGEKGELIQAWFEQKRAELSMPIYGSVDIRDSGYKVGVVDANFFPAGFNNICAQDLEESVSTFHKSIKSQFNHMRINDNKLYPSFFKHKNCEYILKIYKTHMINE